MLRARYMSDLAADNRLLVTSEEAARLLSLGHRTVERLLADGVLRAVHIGRARRIATEDLRRYAARLAEEEHD